MVSLLRKTDFFLNKKFRLPTPELSGSGLEGIDSCESLSAKAPLAHLFNLLSHYSGLSSFLSSVSSWPDSTASSFASSAPVKSSAFGASISSTMFSFEISV